MESLVDSVTVLSTGGKMRNTTTNSTHVTAGPQIWSTEHLVATTVILGLIILCTIIGNVFVIAAITLDKNLRRVANYLILSLAVTDCMVASVVMPISAVNEVSKRWVFSSAVCSMWITTDILLCTASILNLVAISVDRYWAVTKTDYIRLRTTKRVFIMLGICWIAALTISVPSAYLSNAENDPTKTGICIVSQDHVFTIFTTVCAFYMPTILLLIIYAKIYAVVRKRILGKKSTLILKLEKQQSKTITEQCKNPPEMTSLSEQSNEYSAFKSNISQSSFDTQDVNEKYGNNENILQTNCMTNKMSDSCDDILKAQKQKEELNRKRERKVAWTLKIITGTFIICWLPFFIIAISAPFIRSKVTIPRLLESITLWLGYCNCLLNPVIYSLFNMEFRSAFKNLLRRKTACW